MKINRANTFTFKYSVQYLIYERGSKIYIGFLFFKNAYLTQNLDNINVDIDRETAEVLFFQSVLIFLDEILGCFLELVCPVEISEDVHVHHVLAAHLADGGLLCLELQRSQIIEIRQFQESFHVLLQTLMRNLSGVEIIHEVSDNLLAVLQFHLVLLLLLHVVDHHGHQDWRLSAQDQSVTREPLPLLTDQDEVGEDLLLSDVALGQGRLDGSEDAENKNKSGVQI